MKTIEEQLGFYLSYHRTCGNVATHFIGIPTIIVSILIPLGWIRIADLALPITGALVFIAAVSLYYLVLDRMLAVLMAAVILPCYLVADGLSRLDWGRSIGWTLALFVGGWILQLVGHSVFEHRKPAFVDNLIQLLIGPLFLVAETLFYLGLRPALKEKVETLSHQWDVPSQQR